MKPIQVFLAVLGALIAFQLLTSFYGVYQQRRAEQLRYEADMQRLKDLNNTIEEATKKLQDFQNK
jgi:cell division protein FtsB